MSCISVRGLAIGVLFGLIAAPAYGGLGQQESSIESDMRGLNASRHASRAQSSYSVHEIASDHLTVREFAANGKVFGVAWEGHHHPDLQKLLGDYFGDFENAVRRQVRVKGQRSQSRIEGDRLIVEKYGHMGWAQGKAYVRDLMPAEVSAHEIR